MNAIPLPDGDTRLFATVGDPVAQVMAPALMSARLAAMRANAIWLPIAADPAQLPSVFAALRGWRSFAGLSITVPHKAASLHLVDRLTPRALASGGINVARRDADGLLLGDMVDGAGFVAGLAARGMMLAGRTAMLVGAGGAGSAIAASLCEARLGALAIVDPDDARVAALRARLSLHYPATRLLEADADHLDLAINATPLGMREADPLPFDPAMLPPGTMVCDIIMHPARTALLARAEALGHPIQPGLPMLEHQADLYLDFFGVTGS